MPRMRCASDSRQIMVAPYRSPALKNDEKALIVIDGISRPTESSRPAMTTPIADAVYHRREAPPLRNGQARAGLYWRSESTRRKVRRPMTQFHGTGMTAPRAAPGARRRPSLDVSRSLEMALGRLA